LQQAVSIESERFITPLTIARWLVSRSAAALPSMSVSRETTTRFCSSSPFSRRCGHSESNRIDLVDENETGLAFSGLCEYLPELSFRLENEIADDLRPADEVEGRGSLRGDGASDHRSSSRLAQRTSGVGPGERVSEWI